MTVTVPAYPIGLNEAGLITHAPGVHGHIRLVGTAIRHARRMLLHWEDDVDYAVLTAGGTRILLGAGIYEQHTFTDSIPESAAVMRALLAELDERLDADPLDVKPPIVIVLEGVEQLFAPGARERAEDGSSAELDRQASLFLRRAIDLIAHRGAAVGMSLFATYLEPPADEWPDTTTVTDGLEGPTYRRDSKPVPLTWA